MKKQKGLFDHYNAVVKFKPKKYWESLDEKEKSTWSTYMINRLISMNPEMCDLISITQKYTHILDDEIVYKLYENLVPKDNRFYRYIKKRKKEKHDKKTIELICKYFECSTKETQEYLELLDNKVVKEIVDSFGLNKEK